MACCSCWKEIWKKEPYHYISILLLAWCLVLVCCWIPCIPFVILHTIINKMNRACIEMIDYKMLLSYSLVCRKCLNVSFHSFPARIEFDYFPKQLTTVQGYKQGDYQLPIMLTMEKREKKEAPMITFKKKNKQLKQTMARERVNERKRQEPAAQLAIFRFMLWLLQSSSLRPFLLPFALQPAAAALLAFLYLRTSSQQPVRGLLPRSSLQQPWVPKLRPP